MAGLLAIITGVPLVSRNRRHGLVLLSTLITLLILASLVLAVQQKTSVNVKVMVRLTDGLQLQAGETAVYERLRGLVADAMVGAVEGRPLLNGTPFELSQGDRNWLVHVQDVEGLVDLYLSPRDTLALLPLDVDRFVATRDRVLAGLIPGERFPTLGASLARFGASEADLGGLVTQGSQTGSLRLLTLPQALLVRAQGIPAGVRQGEQVQRVVIEIEPK